MAEDDAALPMTHVNVYSTRADSESGFLFVLMNSRSRRSIRTRTRAIGHGELLKGKVVSRGISQVMRRIYSCDLCLQTFFFFYSKILTSYLRKYAKVL